MLSSHTTLLSAVQELLAQCFKKRTVSLLFSLLLFNLLFIAPLSLQAQRTVGKNDDSIDLNQLESNQLLQRNGIYRLRNQCSNKVLDVLGASQHQGAPVVQWGSNNGWNQLWQLRASTNFGFYNLVAQHSNKSLSVADGAVGDGALVSQQPSSRKITNQQWRIIDVGNGYYKLRANYAPDKVLDVNGSSTENGATVQVWTDNGSCAQRWKLELVEEGETQVREAWSNPATWGGSVPAPGTSVTIPLGKTVVLDQNVTLKNLMVNGTLIFSDAHDLTLNADWIMVHGKLQIGTAVFPHQHKATITLTDLYPGENIMDMGDKVLGVMSGTLDLHGQSKVSWTKLDATAEAGAAQLILKDNVNWQPGDRIVVASSSFNWSETEERTVTNVQGNVVTLDQPLNHRHWGTLQTIAGFSVDECAEVGLLSRNIVVQGEQASSSNGFGGHTMVMAGGNARIDGAEFVRMGQKALNRRYPIHLHLLGDSGVNSYVKNTSVHHAFNRAVTVHGTNNMLVQNNVTYDVLGHCFFLEDGAETGNTFDRNLALLTRRPAANERVLPLDENPSAFWITNPGNIFTGNVAASTQGKGFWFALPDRPTGLSTGRPERPVNTPLGGFDGNVAHSNEHEGLYIDDRVAANGTNFDHTVVGIYSPRVNWQDPNSAVSPPEFKNLTLYKHGARAIWYRADRMRLVNPIFADNGISVSGANGSWIGNPDEDKAQVLGGAIIGLTSNQTGIPEWVANGVTPLTGIMTYDARVVIKGVTFVNYQHTNQYKAGAVGLDENDQHAVVSVNLVENAVFVNSVPTWNHNPDGIKRTIAHLDKDGSWVGAPGQYIVGNYPIALTPNCTSRPDLNGFICSNRYATLGTSVRAAAMITRDDGVSHARRFSDDPFPLILNRRYVLSFTDSQPTNYELGVHDIKGGEMVRLAVPYPNANFKIRRDWIGTYYLQPATSLSAVEADAGGTKYFYDSATRLVHLKLVQRPNWYADFIALWLEPN